MAKKTTSRTTKTRESKSKAQTAPQSQWELSQMHPYCGEEHFPGPEEDKLERAKVHALPRKLMTKSSPLVEVRGHVPEDASRFFRPRRMPDIEGRRLRRFSGKRVTPLNNQTFVFPPDDRYAYYDSSYPWRCIGKMYWIDSKTGGITWGTATLVGRNYVVTACHVLPIANNTLTHTVNFVPAYNGSGSLLGSGFNATVTQAAYWELNQDNVVGYDMAIARLSQPLGDKLGYFGSRTYTSDWEDNAWWDAVGYPYDYSGGNVPTFQNGIAVLDDDSDDDGTRELETHADTSSGSSGGPLFGFWDGLPRVLGVCSGNETEFEYTFPFGFTANNNVFAGGDGLTRLIHWGRENWG